MGSKQNKLKYLNRSYRSGFGEWINGNKKVVQTDKQKQLDKRIKYKSYLDYE